MKTAVSLYLLYCNENYSRHIQTMLSDVGLIILAAGASTRMGRPKQLLEYQGETLIRKTVNTAVNSLCQPIVVVLGAYAEKIKPEIKSFPVTIAFNRNWSNGMSTSVSIGIETLLTLNPELDAIVLMLCDQPFVSASLIDRLVETHRATRQNIIASQYSKTIGVPALFPRHFFPLLSKLQGDRGAKGLIKQFLPTVKPVLFPSGEFDIDTPSDYSRLING